MAVLAALVALAAPPAASARVVGVKATIKVTGATSATERFTSTSQGTDPNEFCPPGTVMTSYTREAQLGWNAKFTGVPILLVRKLEYLLWANITNDESRRTSGGATGGTYSEQWTVRQFGLDGCEAPQSVSANAKLEMKPRLRPKVEYGGVPKRTELFLHTLPHNFSGEGQFDLQATPSHYNAPGTNDPVSVLGNLPFIQLLEENRKAERRKTVPLAFGPGLRVQSFLGKLAPLRSGRSVQLNIADRYSAPCFGEPGPQESATCAHTTSVDYTIKVNPTSRISIGG